MHDDITTNPELIQKEFRLAINQENDITKYLYYV